MLPIVFGDTSLSTFDSDMLNQLQMEFDSDFSELGGGALHRIKVNKTDFSLVSGRSEERIPMDKLFVVFVASNPRSHCTWYTRAYVPGQEPAAPDLCWWSGDPYPDDLPAEYHNKINRDGVERWGYQTQRRTAWAILRQNQTTGQLELDDDHVYIMDITSANLFGTGNAQMGMYKWSELAGLCRSWSRTAGHVITPSMFATQIVLDTSSPLPGIVLFRPMVAKGGTVPVLMPMSIIQAVMKLREDPATKKALEINEKRSMTGTTTAPVQSVSAPVSAPIPPQPTVIPAASVSAPQEAPVTTNTAQMDDILAMAEAELDKFNAAKTAAPQPQTAPANDSMDIDSLLSSL